MSFARRVAVLALGLSLVLPAGAAGSVTGLDRTAERSVTATSGLPVTALPVVMAALGANDPALAARGYGALVALENADSGLALTADPAGVSLMADAGSLRLSPVALGRGTTLAALPDESRPVADANRVTTVRGDLLTEWLINAPAGIEQGFTVASDPAPGTPGDLVLSLALTGDLASRAFLDTPTRLAFTGTTLAWEGLAAWDAQGTVLPARLALDGDRLTVTVADTGAVYPLTIDPTWVQQASLKASNTAAYDLFGASVAISGDTIVVGAPDEDSCDTGSIVNPDDDACTDAGAAYVFTRSGTTWSQQASLKAGNTGAGDAFGASAAISGDTIVIGADGEDSCDDGTIVNPGDDGCADAGAAYVFTRLGSAWSQQGSLKASNPGAGDEFGWSVASSGRTIVVGAVGEASCDTGAIVNPGDDGCADAGAAYVFARWGPAWSLQASLKASNTGAGDFFGDAVAVADATIVVGAFGEASCDTDTIVDPGDDACPGAGAAYVFARSGATWSQQASLKASNTGTGDEFGAAVASSRGRIAVSAIGEGSCDDGSITNPGDDACPFAGAVYVFTGAGSTWSPQASLKASNTGPGDAFGWSVAIFGTTIVAGAVGESSCGDGTIVNPGDDGCDEAGAAYVFTRSGPTWSQTASLKASDSGTYDFFGSAVAISGGTIVVGALGEASCDDGTIADPGDDGCPEAGAAYVFPADTTAPQVGSVRTEPATPEAGTRVKVTAVAGDPSGVVSAQVRVGKGKPVAMRGVNGFGRTRQKLARVLTLPRAGRHSICVRATDAEGNRSPWRCTLVTVAALVPDPSPVPSPDPGSSPVPSPIASPVPSPGPGSSPAP